MTATGEGPAWLAALQRRFGDVLRQPLATRGGHLSADVAGYPGELIAAITSAPPLDARARLATYHRQYWFRLFGVLHDQHRLTTALVGPWALNLLAMAYLAEMPPRGADLATVGDGFAAFLAQTIRPRGVRPRPGATEVPRAVILEAVAIDRAFHELAYAPEPPPFRPGEAERAILPERRLVPSGTTRVLHESRPLAAFRQTLGRTPPTAASAPPPTFDDGPRPILIARRGDEWRVVPLERAQARLYALVEAHPLAEALAMLEAEHAEHPDLAARTQAWLQEGTVLGCWRGLA